MEKPVGKPDPSIRLYIAYLDIYINIYILDTLYTRLCRVYLAQFVLDITVPSDTDCDGGSHALLSSPDKGIYSR